MSMGLKILQKSGYAVKCTKAEATKTVGPTEVQLKWTLRPSSNYLQNSVITHTKNKRYIF